MQGHRTIPVPPRRGDAAWLTLAAGCVAVISVLTIGSYVNRLAGVHDDNGAVFYAYLYRHAQDFVRDPFAHPGIHWLWGSICFWLPVLAQNYLGLDARVLDAAFYVLQISLLGLAVLIWTWNVSRSWITAFASMALAYLAQPWAWNLAAYWVTTDLPLYTALAFALSALAGAAFVARRWNLAWLLTIATALVHPIIACDLLAMLTLWGLLEFGSWNSWKWPAIWMRLAVLLALCGAPFLIRAGFTEPLLTPSEQWESVSKHMHSVPWGNSALFRQAATIVLDFFLVAACCWRQLLAMPSNQRRFLTAALLGTLAVSLVQIIGALGKIPALALTMGLRSFSILILLVWPFVFTILFSEDQLKRWHICFCGILLGLMFYGMNGGLPLFHLALFALVTQIPDRLFAGRRAVYVALLGALPLALIPLGYGSWLFLRGPVDISIGFYLFSLLVSFLLAELFTVPLAEKPLRLAMAVTLMALAMARAQSLGAQTRSPAVVGLRDAELWARDHTPSNTLFITNYGWRTLSQRPAVLLTPNLTEEIYTPFRSIRDRNLFLFGLYGIADTWRDMGIYKIIAASDAGYRRLTRDDFMELSRRFGAPYLVRANDEPALDFPLVYRNATYGIYRIP